MTKKDGLGFALMVPGVTFLFLGLGAFSRGVSSASALAVLGLLALAFARHLLRDRSAGRADDATVPPEVDR